MLNSVSSLKQSVDFPNHTNLRLDNGYVYNTIYISKHRFVQLGEV